MKKSGTRPGLTWWERLLWVVLAGAAYAASSLLSGCGHTVDVTAERAEICRDDSCLVLEPGHLSYSQKQPKTEMPPVIRKIRQGKCWAPSDLLPRRFSEKRLFRSRSDGDCPVSQRLGRHKKKLGMNALSAAFSYYLAAGRRVEEMEEDGRLQDVYIRTPELVLMARRVDSEESNREPCSSGGSAGGSSKCGAVSGCSVSAEGAGEPSVRSAVAEGAVVGPSVSSFPTWPEA